MYPTYNYTKCSTFSNNANIVMRTSHYTVRRTVIVRYAHNKRTCSILIFNSWVVNCSCAIAVILPNHKSRRTIISI